MAAQPKENSENKNGVRSLVSDLASWARGGRGNEELKASLDDVLTELEAGKRENEEFYMADRIDAEATFGPEPAQAKAAVKAAPVHPDVKAAQPAPAAVTPPPVSNPTADAQRRADEHRQRLEKLLNDAREIEQMLAKEAAEARALAESVNLEEKRTAAARAVEAERQAATHAGELAQRSEAATVKQMQYAADLRAAREAVDAATDAVTECQAKLVEAQKQVIQTKFKLRESEVRAQEAAKVAEDAKAEARAAERRAAKLREARETAEGEVHQAEEIASSIALTNATLERIRALGGKPSK